MTASELARELRVSVRWLKRAADDGLLPHVKAERTYLFDPAVVVAALGRLAADRKAATNG